MGRAVTDHYSATPNKNQGTFIEVPESEPLRNECQHFLDCCRARTTPRTDAREGLGVLQFLKAAQSSLDLDGEAAGPLEGGNPRFFAHPSAIVADGAEIGPGTKIWHFSHVMAGAVGDNRAYAVGADDPVQNAIYTWLWPNTAFFISPGRNNLAVFQMVPKGPELTEQVWDFYFEDAELNDAERAMVNYTCDILIPEDAGLCENVQRGLRSPGYRQGRFVVNRANPELSEHHVHMFQKLVRDAVLGAP